MKRIIEYINENLSSENLSKLSDYVNDENFESLFNEIKKASIRLKTRIKSDSDKSKDEKNLEKNYFKKFFINHGLTNKAFNGKPNLGHRIADIFVDNEEVDEFNKVILNSKYENGGLISFDELSKDKEGNIFDICKDFKKSAKEILNINNVTAHNRNVGKCEILLKFILSDKATIKGKGDVSLENDINIEVKGFTPGKKGGAINPSSIESLSHTSKEFLKWLNYSNLEYTGKGAEKKKDGDKIGGQFLGSENANKALEKLVNTENNEGKTITDVDFLLENFVKAYAFQYMVGLNSENVDKILSIIKKYNDEEKIIKLEDDKISISKSLTDMIGLIQLYLYSVVEEFNYIFVINQEKGNYSLLEINKRNNSGKITSFTDYKDILNFVKFDAPEAGPKATGSRVACRIYPKNNPKNNN